MIFHHKQHTTFYELALRFYLFGSNKVKYDIQLTICEIKEKGHYGRSVNYYIFIITRRNISENICCKLIS